LALGPSLPSAQAGSEASCSNPGDDIGSLPSTSSPQLPGLILVGSAPDLRELITGWSGEGHLAVRRLDDGLLSIRLVGDVSLGLDREVLETTRVAFGWSGGAIWVGGAARVTLDGMTVRRFRIDEDTALRLPVRRLLGPDAGEHVVHVDARGPAGELHRSTLASSGDRLILQQRHGT